MINKKLEIVFGDYTFVEIYLLIAFAGGVFGFGWNVFLITFVIGVIIALITKIK